MIFGHLPATALAGKVIFNKWFNPLTVFVLAFLPDLLDKNLHLLFGIPSRGYSHTVFAAIALYLVAAMVCRWTTKYRNSRFPLQLLCFYLLHLACDSLSPKILFWPLLSGGKGEGYKLEDVAFSAKEIIYNFYIGLNNVPMLLCELLFTVAMAILLIRSWRRSEFFWQRT